MNAILEHDPLEHDIRAAFTRQAERTTIDHTPQPVGNTMTISFNPAPRRSSRVRLPALAAAAALIVVAGLVAVNAVRPITTADVSAPMPDPVPAIPTDPTEPLFVLPADIDAMSLRDADVAQWPMPDGWPTDDIHWATLGTPHDGGYEALVGAVSVSAMEQLAGEGNWDEWDEVDTATGPAYVYPPSIPAGGEPSWPPMPPGDVVIQQRGTHWLQITSPGVDEVDLLELLAAIEIAEDGAISLDSPTHTMFAEGIHTPDASAIVSFTIGDHRGDFSVETAAIHPLWGIDFIGERVEPVAIGERSGWLLSRRIGSGLSPVGVAWSATPHHMIAVSANDDRDLTASDLVAIAEQLRIVDEDTWRTAFPDATSKTVTPETVTSES